MAKPRRKLSDEQKELLGKNIGAIYKAINKYSSKNERKDDDFVADAVEYVVNCFPTYNSKISKISNFIYLVAKFGVSSARSARKYEKFPILYGTFWELLTKDETNLYKLDLMVIQNEVNKLPEPVRKIIYNLFWEFKTQAEIGREMGISRQRIEQQAKRGLDLLRTKLKGKFDQEDAG